MGIINKEKKTEFTVLLDMIVNSELGKNQNFSKYLISYVKHRWLVRWEKGLFKWCGLVSRQAPF